MSKREIPIPEKKHWPDALKPSKPWPRPDSPQGPGPKLPDPLPERQDAKFREAKSGARING